MEAGYRCHKPYSSLWGQYSPYFSLEKHSSISPDTPPGCTVTFAQVLARHGARYPTDHKTKDYADIIRRIHRKTTSYSAEYAFLRDFEYPLGEEDMTAFGEAQMANAGTQFYQRYQHLGQRHVPFIRASGSPRVIVSAEKFIDGFHETKSADSRSEETDEPPSVGVVISEKPGANNTLDQGGCARFEDGDEHSEIAKQFASTFVPSIAKRVNSNLVGARLDSKDIVQLMEICPFHTVASSPDASSLSPFCALFTEHEWASYDYLQSLTKYYRYGPGNTLGATQGVGFVNELIARLTSTAVDDNTTVNTTLDNDPTTFPLNRTLYADFSHDNTMVSIFTALGLFNSTQPLSHTTIQTPDDETDGYAASWAVPFAGRAYIEKMECDSDSDSDSYSDSDSSPVESQPYVRVLLNDRVVPLQGCRVDALGRCRLDDFIEGLSFARRGGAWEKCAST